MNKFSISELENHVQSLLHVACILEDYRDDELVTERDKIIASDLDINNYKQNLIGKKIDDVDKAVGLLHQSDGFL